MFVDRPPEKLTPAAGLANKPHLELLLKTVGPFHIALITLDTITIDIDEDGVHNTASTDHVTRAPGKTGATIKADKRDTPKKCVPPPLYYHAMTELTRPNILLNDSSDISDPAIKINMSSVGTGNSHVKIPSNLPATTRYILLLNIGVDDIVFGNRLSLLSKKQKKRYCMK